LAAGITRFLGTLRFEASGMCPRAQTARRGGQSIGARYSLRFAASLAAGFMTTKAPAP